MKKNKQGKKKYKIQFEENKIIRKFNVGVKACAERDKWNKGNGYPKGEILPS